MDEMKKIVEDADISSFTGANEAGFEAFHEWYKACRIRHAGEGSVCLVCRFDVESLVGFFDADLKEYWQKY